PWITIVGVAADVRQDSLNDARTMTLYRPMAQAPATDMTIVARTTGDVASLGAAVRAAAKDLDHTVPVSDVRTMDDIVTTSLARARFTAGLLTGFALLALVLGAVGIYGVVSYTVAQRTRELGVRMALGATPLGVLRLVMGRGAALAAAGAALGIAASLGTTRALAGLLYGVSATDVLTFVVAPVLLFGVAVLATWVPARRAVRVDPLTALRAE
ncbi:MAG: FtsX-like permease family protein, partial [Gemmatimonadales bacterium]